MNFTCEIKINIVRIQSGIPEFRTNLLFVRNFFIKIFIAIPLSPQMCLYTAGPGSTAFKSTTGNKIFREYYLII